MLRAYQYGGRKRMGRGGIFSPVQFYISAETAKVRLSLSATKGELSICGKIVLRCVCRDVLRRVAPIRELINAGARKFADASHVLLSTSTRQPTWLQLHSSEQQYLQCPANLF